MTFLKNCLRNINSLLLSSIIFCLLIYLPLPTFSQDLQLPSIASELSENFSDSFCLSFSETNNPKSAGEQAAKKISKGLIFSHNLKEIMDLPKEDLTLSISTNIFKICGDKLEITQDELNDYLFAIAKRDRQELETKPFKPFGIG